MTDYLILILTTRGGLLPNSSTTRHLTLMGSLCSKSGSHSGGHTVLGSASGAGGTSSSGPRPEPRSAAAEAAEARLKSVRTSPV